jgi:menaquinone-dependent protoporphyrinogen oxidase
MTVLVAAASKHGATQEIAQRIGAGLAERGFDVQVKRLEEVDSLDGYEAFLIGSAIYLGNWRKEARRFVDTHAGELAERPTWLFASGSITGDPPVADDPNAVRPSLPVTLLETTHARELKLFAGRLDSSKLNMLERTSVRMAHAHDGDYRDWQVVDEWAVAIASQLHSIQSTGLAASS